MDSEDVLRFLGLAKRAGHLVSGEFMTENAVRSGEAALVVIAGDVSSNTEKKFKNMCEFYEVPIRKLADKESLGHSLGKEYRASLAVTDEGMAKTVLEKMQRKNANGGF
ncbi:MAG: ribosomal L7Ae/L30e/S12e/Gadd45 family protein [Lachnospiraceae bacterium]|nr:ribosomal L7Ae/L30e/S12e/Gadd45 family protein [Lachnospiraceae bacterium]